MRRAAKGPRRLPPTRAKKNERAFEAIIGRAGARVYLAAPVAVLGSPRHLRALRRLRAVLPRAEVVDPAELFVSSADWRARWPGVLAGLDAVVFLTARDGTIGAGVAQEILDAHLRGLPVAHLTAAGKLVPAPGLRLRLLEAGDPRRFARVLAGGKR